MEAETEETFKNHHRNDSLKRPLIVSLLSHYCREGEGGAYLFSVPSRACRLCACRVCGCVYSVDPCFAF